MVRRGVVRKDGGKVWRESGVFSMSGLRRSIRGKGAGVLCKNKVVLAVPACARACLGGAVLGLRQLLLFCWRSPSANPAIDIAGRAAMDARVPSARLAGHYPHRHARGDVAGHIAAHQQRSTLWHACARDNDACLCCRYLYGAERAGGARLQTRIPGTKRALAALLTREVGEEGIGKIVRKA